MQIMHCAGIMQISSPDVRSLLLLSYKIDWVNLEKYMYYNDILISVLQIYNYFNRST